MPHMCFSYEADAPSSIGHRDVPEPAPPGPRQMTTTHCLGYLADLNRMTNSACFSYPTDVPSGPREHDVAEPLPSGLHSMTFGTCFRY
jgi:hypothetical protein